MRESVLAIDQGTTSSKALLIDPTTLEVLASAARVLAVTSPRPGWVEQDPTRVWESVRESAAEVLAKRPDVRAVAVAISNQRESVVMWDGPTGLPIGPLVSWQDQRGVDLCRRLSTPDNVALVDQRTGLELNAMYSAAKMRWLVDQAKGRDGVRIGTVDAWLLDRLTGGRTYAIEAGNASRTLLFDIAKLSWDSDLCSLFGVPESVLPEVRPSSGPWGTTRGVSGIPDGLPILAILGDSHAALFGHWALAPDYAAAGKATYGTGSSIMVPAHGVGERRSGVSLTLAWLLDEPLWAYEANILYSGSGMDWLGKILGVAGGRGLSELAAGTTDSAGAVFVPALNGLGAPWWEPDAVGTLTGLTFRTERSDLARAGLESVAHQVCDVLDTMDPGKELGLLHVGGGATASDLLMQVQANLLGRELLVAAVTDISPLGVGALAGVGLGIHPIAQAAHPVRFLPDPAFTPERRHDERTRWRNALASAGVTPSSTKTKPQHQEGAAT
jgi:glycerol kinase